MTLEHQDEKLGKGLSPGSHHYRAFIGPPEMYGVNSAIQFNLLTFLGLREEHYLLDIGCGSLRAGKLFIPYLLTGHYFGIEPEKWLVEEGIINELGKDMVRIKAPVIINDDNFTCGFFNRKFDYILAHSIFSHTSQTQIKKCLSNVRECMKPSSIFAATFWKGNDDYAGDTWDYTTCIVYTQERIIQLSLENGLICEPIDWPHPNQQWVLISHPENEHNIQYLIETAGQYNVGKN